MSKKKKKHKKEKSTIDYKVLIINAIVDLTVGIILVILDKLLN